MATPSNIVLYAEDDENDAFFMERAFARLNRPHELHVVSTGKRAMDYLQEHATTTPPRLAILDIKMPEMSGLEVLLWLRSRPEFVGLPTVMFTSSTQQSDVELSRIHGANAYFVKPSNAQNLAQLMERVLAAIGASDGGRLALPENLL